ncbi:hypothetical protein LDENG_00283850 [Lucifuga dentata]|nr:hypothetical protein LDENG_00283850 [Lucifuga dentata]
MHYPLTTRSQKCFQEQIKKETLTRLAWKSRYAKLYPSCSTPQNESKEPVQLLHLPANERRIILPPVTKAPEKQSDLPPPPPPPPVVSVGGEGGLGVVPLMRPVSPQSIQALYQDSSHHV